MLLGIYDATVRAVFDVLLKFSFIGWIISIIACYLIGTMLGEVTNELDEEESDQPKLL